MSQKPSIPKGTRDFTPQEMANRNYIFNTIKSVFQLYGFQQIETPAMENLSTLMGKYGEEGDKLLFKILNSGDFLSDFDFKQIEAIKEYDDLKNKYLKDSSDVISSLNTEKENNDFYRLVEKKLIIKGIIEGTDNNEITFDGSEFEFHKILNETVLESIREITKKKFIEPYVSTEKGLRYDLTVPFARFVVQNRDKISFPFKRYQIQPVWRADRPQKGRYREFYQCDVDVVGSDSLLNELELIQIVDEVYRRLKINVVIKINNRKILSGIAEIIGEAEKITDITVAIDKLDKIGLEKVNEEIASKGISQDAIDKLQPILKLSGTNSEKLNQLKAVLATSETGLKGIDEMETIFGLCETMQIKTRVELDLTLARGLNYYTGAIFEVKALDVEIGSITGGGRYDNLTGVFGMPGVSGVGISFGADRIYDVLNQLNLYPETSEEQTRILFVSFGEKELMYCLPWLKTLRENGINCEIYPEPAKMKKQMSYADNKNIPFVAIVGENEMSENKVMLKNMKTGEQILCSPEELLNRIATN